MKVVIVKQDRWDEIFADWLRETKELAVSPAQREDMNVARFLQYHVCSLKRRLEEAQ